MSFFDKVKDTVSATGVSQKVSYTTNTMKLNNMIKANEREIDRISFEIGKDYVQRHLQETGSEYQEQLDAIRRLQAEISGIYQELERLKAEQEEARQRAQEEREARALARQQEAERQRQMAYQQQVEYQQQMAAYQQQMGYQQPVQYQQPSSVQPEAVPQQTEDSQQPTDSQLQTVSFTESPSNTESSVKFCAKCGGENDMDSRFCVHCGNSF